MKKVIALIMVLGISTVAFGQLPAPKLMYPGGGVTLDGNLSDWATANWLTLGVGNPDGGVTWGAATDLTNAKYAARWVAGGIYVAVSQVDTVPAYEAQPPSNWNSTDHIEVYVDSANTNWVGYAYDGTGGPMLAFSKAQQFVITPDGSALPAVFQGLGFPPTVPGPIGVTPATVVLSITGTLVEYEMFIPAQVDDAPMVLTFASTVGLDLATLSGTAVGGTYSMLQANGVGGKFNNAAMFQDWILIPEPMTMILLGMGGVALIRRKK